MTTSRLDERLSAGLSRWGVPALRISLAIVYLWFGALKIAGVTPVGDLVQNLYPALPEPLFLRILGIWEVAIGVGLLARGVYLRAAIVLMWLQMAGIMSGLVFKPSLFFQDFNPLLLNLNGEFLIKNLVLIAATFVIWSAGAKPIAQTKN